MFFVFRNNTVERFFEKEYSFSGYGDVSIVPQYVDGYIWWYQVPVKYDQEILAQEVYDYINKLNYVLSKINTRKTFVAFTMDVIYNVPFTDVDHRVSQAVCDYNNVLYAAEQTNGNIKVLDISEFNRQYNSSELIDWKFYFISQMCVNPKLHKEFKAWFTGKTRSIALKRKKCLVLDLDNTLWGGVLGEDGIEGIKIGGDYPGKAFLYWQNALKELAKSGIILTVCSKNNERDVLEAWEKNPFNVLKKDDFSAYRINWNNKADNIKDLASELNIGLDSFVFVDDNPAEREFVRKALPMIAVPDFPEQPYMLPVFFKQLVNDYFKAYSLTDEDRNKLEQYKANVARTHLQASFVDFDAFLKSLDIQITIEAANDFNIQRISQMTQKTNQFNLTTHRYTDVDIRGFIEQGWKIWCLSVKDKFGDSGITGCIMVNGSIIDTFLLSCRILGKGIEFAFIKTIIKILKESGTKVLRAQYVPTIKNGQVRDFWDNCGFECVHEDDDGIKSYYLSLANSDISIKDYYIIKIV